MKRLPTVIVFGLAGARLTRAWRYEQIGTYARFPLKRWLQRRHLKELDDLIECPHCFGFWLTLLIAITWRFRVARPIIEALAGAMIVSTIVDHYPNYDYESDGT